MCEYSEALPERRAQNKTPGLCFLTVNEVGPFLLTREFLYQKTRKKEQNANALIRVNSLILRVYAMGNSPLVLLGGNLMPIYMIAPNILKLAFM